MGDHEIDMVSVDEMESRSRRIAAENIETYVGFAKPSFVKNIIFFRVTGRITTSDVDAC